MVADIAAGAGSIGPATQADAQMLGVDGFRGP
jgi:hypothetical protein